MLDQKCRGAAELAGDREALQQARNEHGDWRENPNRVVDRHDGHQAGTDRHDDDRQQHGGAAPSPVGVGAKHEGAERPRQVRNSERTERQQQRCGRIGRREKQL